MNGRLSIRIGRWLICSLVACLLARAEDRPVTPVALGDGLYVFSGTMANSVALIGGDGVLLVDGGDSAAVAASLQQAISGLTDRPVRLLLNTHWHFDHVNGNGYFAHRGAVILGQTAMRDRAGKQPGQKDTQPLPADELPAITFDQELVLHVGGEEVLLRHPRRGVAHTDGDAMVFFRHANVVHMGDVYFAGLYPYIDVDADGSAEAMAAAAEEMLPLMNDQTKVVPGHGPVSDKQKLAAYAAMLRDISAQVQQMVEAGKTLEEVQAAKPTRAYDDPWGKAWMKPDQFVELVYRGIVKHRPAKA